MTLEGRPLTNSSMNPNPFASVASPQGACFVRFTGAHRRHPQTCAVGSN